MQSCFGWTVAPLQFSPGKISSARGPGGDAVSAGVGLSDPPLNCGASPPLLGGGVSEKAMSVIVTGSVPTLVTVAVLTWFGSRAASESNTLRVSMDRESACAPLETWWPGRLVHQTSAVAPSSVAIAAAAARTVGATRLRAGAGGRSAVLVC